MISQSKAHNLSLLHLPPLSLWSFFRGMDESGSTGNPSAASSHLLPALTNEEMLQPPDWISVSEEDNRQSSKSVSGLRSQNDQRPAETQQKAAVEHQRSVQKQRTAEEPDQLGLREHTNHEDPPTEEQKDSPSRPEQLIPNPLPTENQKLEDSPHTDKEEEKDSTSPKEQPDQKTPGDPSSAKHEQEVDDSQEHQTQEDRFPGNQKAEEDPPPPKQDFTVFTSTLDKDDQKTLQLHITKSKDQQYPQAPPPPHPNTQQAPPLSVEMFGDQTRPRPPVSSSEEPKLCGFLLKQGGPLKAWKLRWFTYEEKKNQLFYYRTPQDVTPLGRVELCSATFTYPLKAESGTFHIQTPERTFVLKVSVLISLLETISFTV